MEHIDNSKAARGRPAGKQPIGPALERVLRLENLLREGGSQGLTVRELTNKLDDEGFPVDKRTVQRDLQTLSYCRQVSCTEDAVPRYFTTAKPDRRLRLLSHRLTTAGNAATNHGNSPFRWRTVTEYSDVLGVSADQVMEDIRSGTLNGIVLRGTWHVLDLVTLDVPDPAHPEHVLLRIAATRNGNHLTAGAECLVIPLSYDPDAIASSTGALMPSPGEEMPETVSVLLNGQPYVVDRTLQSDLAATLFLWQVDMDLGPLLAQYPSDSA